MPINMLKLDTGQHFRLGLSLWFLTERYYIEILRRWIMRLRRLLKEYEIMHSILITGATGQIGTELTMALRERYGNDNVIASGLNSIPDEVLRSVGHFHFIDCTNREQIEQVVKKHKVDTIFHLAALLSAVAEDEPGLAWEVNVGGLYNVLEVARKSGCAVFTPSSIGAFGPSTPADMTPQDTIQRPTSMYGVTKVSGELLCDYYHTKFGVDTRGVRYPGIISYKAPPGGGTTDYAIEIFSAALTEKKYTCYLKPDTMLDMMYMPDALKAAMDIMEADTKPLLHRNAFNITAMSVTPEILAAEIRKHIPDFQITYEIDPVRQAIANSWPDKLDDTCARNEWGWAPDYDLCSMTADMLKNLSDNTGQSRSTDTCLI